MSNIASHASRLGIPLDEYLQRMANNEKWCWQCQHFHHRSAFGRNASRADGLTQRCLASARVHKDKREVATRSGDGVQARLRIGALVRRGVYPRACELRCAVIGCKRRAKGYHHAWGYDSLIAHYTVVPLCREHHKIADRQLRSRK